MRNLQKIISEQLLPYIRQPGQYVGLEVNARCNDVTTADVTVAMGFPDAYTIGISHLGHQVLYHLLNDIPGVACDRTYCPTVETETVMREKSLPLFSWESRCHIADFDVLGFTLSYELCVTNVLTMLDLAGIPLAASDRTADHPIVIGGDALADTPEPIAEFFDVLIPGDGETPITALVEIIREAKQGGASREETLLRIAREVPSAYVPQFYAQGEAGVAPIRDDLPTSIPRAYLPQLEGASLPAYRAPLVPLSEGVHERVVVEIMRGCPNFCRFCQAGHTRLPVRRRSIEEIITAARAGIEATGYREISLLSLSISDYPNLEELIERLNAEFASQKVSISLPSLRVDSQLTVLPKLTSEVRKGGLTIAAEAGSERLRLAIRKGITEEDMIAGVQAAWAAGYRSVKVYFMAGLPDETLDDIDEIAHLCRRLSNTRRDFDGYPGNINASVSWLVPKPHTPMQWEAMRTSDYFFDVRARLLDMTRKSTVNVKFHRIEQSLLEALIARGGREVGKVIRAAWNLGARMDSWSENWDWDIWADAISESGVDFDGIVHSDIPTGRQLPWSHIKPHLPDDYLLKQRREMYDVLEMDT
ncbi:MAG: TIGR03960 family B12-binding radical SAM protein [Phycisphaerae bacterium]|nr:TIGR03960 family B12-binding radical SAM protein [Phycisphaerae bacterium]